MPVPDFFRVLALRLFHGVCGDLEDAEGLLLDRHIRRAFACASEIGAGDVDPQQAELTEDGQANLEGLHLPAQVVQYLQGEKAFALSLVDVRRVESFDQASEMLGAFVSLQAHLLLVFAIGVHQRNVVLGSIFGEAVQAIGDNELDRRAIPLKHDLVTVQVLKPIRGTIVFERIPSLDRVDMKFRQACPSGIGIEPYSLNATILPFLFCALFRLKNAPISNDFFWSH